MIGLVTLGNWIHDSCYTNPITEIVLGGVVLGLGIYILYGIDCNTRFETESWRPCFEEHSSCQTVEVLTTDELGNSIFGEECYVQKVYSATDTYRLWYTTKNGSPDIYEFPVHLTTLVYISDDQAPHLEVTIAQDCSWYNSMTEKHWLGVFRYTYILYIHEGCTAIAFN